MFDPFFEEQFPKYVSETTATVLKYKKLKNRW